MNEVKMRWKWRRRGSGDAVKGEKRRWNTRKGKRSSSFPHFPVSIRLDGYCGTDALAWLTFSVAHQSVAKLAMWQNRDAPTNIPIHLIGPDRRQLSRDTSTITQTKNDLTFLADDVLPLTQMTNLWITKILARKIRLVLQV
jgi:hypothetical protein